MRSLIFILLATIMFSSTAQRLIEKNIEIGMTIVVKPCKKGSKSFESMDLYTKTRYPASGIQIDTPTGYGIFENFFSPGDFDAKRLPCIYGNKRYTVAALKIYMVEDKPKRVMVCYTSNPLAMIWIEFDKAIELNEIEW